MAGALRMYAGHPRAAAQMKQAVADIVENEVSMDGEIGLTTLAVLMPAELWDLDAMRVLATRYREHDLGQGSMGSLRSSQAALGRVHLLEGDFSSSQLLMSELRGLVAMLSPEPSVVDTPYEAELFVWMGEETKAREIIDALINRWGVLLGKSVLEDWGWMSLAVLENSLGNYEQALEAASQAVDHDHVPWSSQALPEAIEAAVRTHNEAEVQLRLAQLRERVAASPTPWSEGLLARSEAICAHGAEADAHFRNAIALLATSGIRTEHARSLLLYGEWLRREGRKLDARVQLKEALTLFNAMGARLFAHRCEVELRATGERIRRDAGDARRLTSQEQQVAELAASGMTQQGDLDQAVHRREHRRVPHDQDLPEARDQVAAPAQGRGCSWSRPRADAAEPVGGPALRTGGFPGFDVVARSWSGEPSSPPEGPAMALPKTLLPLTAAAFALGTTEFVVVGLLPTIASATSVSVASAGTLVTAYAVGIAVGGPLPGVVAAAPRHRSQHCWPCWDCSSRLTW